MFHRVPTVAVLALLPGCAHTALTCPERGGAAWSELSSPHFVLRTDVPPVEALATLREFERSYGALESLAFGEVSPGIVGARARPARSPIELVLFRREEDFRAFAPAGAMGWYRPRQNNDVERRPTIALHGRLRTAAVRRLQHELVHGFLSRHIRRAPPWIEEGLAEYYSTLELDPTGFAVLGGLPMKKMFVTEIHNFGTLAERWVESRVALSSLPPVARLITASDAAFHAPDDESAHYAAAWVLVHLLQHGPPAYRPRFRAYLDALAAGASHATAWRDSFRGVDGDALERDFRAYATRAEVQVERRRHTFSEPPSPGPLRPLSDGEVHLLWARIRPWDSRENIFTAAEDLDAARRALPADPEVDYWAALHEQLWRHWDNAALHLRRALAKRPGEPRYLHALAELSWSAARARGSDDLAVVDALVDTLAAQSSSPYAREFIARYLDARGRTASGLPFARRAVEEAPDCWECADTYARLLQGEPPPGR